MKKTTVVLATAIAMAVPACALAAAWNVPTNVRVVQKSNTDTSGRIYGNIQSAINSITNASATNPYVVKVMPGIYDLGTSSIQLKDYVTLEGSGVENTIIISSISAQNSDDCSAATVNMSNNSVLKNITVKNTFTDQGAWNLLKAIGLTNVDARLEDTNAYVAGDNAAHNVGICVYGPAGKLVLKNAYIETINNSGNQSSPILATQGSIVDIANSKLVGIGTNAVDVINCSWGLSGTPGTAIVSNSYVEGSAPGVYGVNGEACNLTVTNSTIVVPAGNSAINVGDDNGTPYSAKVANSLISGGVGAITGFSSAAKLINNHDQNFNAILNQ